MHRRYSGRVSVVVPARNEEATIEPVLEACLQVTDDLIVVDGHSTDATQTIARALNVKVVEDNGLGKGDAVRVGLEVARYPVTLFIDADGSHDVRDIPKLVEPILRDEADLVIGSRMRGGSDELFSDFAEVVRLIGSVIISLTINYRFGVRLTDYQNGFRAIRTEVGRSIGLTSDATTIEQEMAMKCLMAGYRVAEVPAHEYRRQGGESKIHVLRMAHLYIWSLVRGIIGRRKKPRLAVGDASSVDRSRTASRRAPRHLPEL